MRFCRAPVLRSACPRYYKTVAAAMGSANSSNAFVILPFVRSLYIRQILPVKAFPSIVSRRMEKAIPIYGSEAPFCRLPQRSVPALQVRSPCERAAGCHRSVRLPVRTICRLAQKQGRALEPLPSSRASAGSHDGCPRRISLSSRDLCFIIEVIAKPFHCASAAMRFHR